jgi:hypothetical protein
MRVLSLLALLLPACVPGATATVELPDASQLGDLCQPPSGDLDPAAPDLARAPLPDLAEPAADLAHGEDLAPACFQGGHNCFDATACCGGLGCHVYQASQICCNNPGQPCQAAADCCPINGPGVCFKGACL